MNDQKTSESSFEQILGVRFFTGSAEEAVKIGLQGGLVVVPAAPALVDLQTDEFYREALLNADLAITDSGLMVLMWRLLRLKNIARVSGLKYLRLLFDRNALNPENSVLWIMPNAAARDQNLAWLRAQGYAFTEADCYLAPNYPAGSVKDDALVKLVNERKARHIVVCIGGGTQERLGLMLKRECNSRPSIHCIGAAIGFLTGNQVRIPGWADKFFLGWLFRCVSEPGKFVPRYWKACKLVPIMIRYQDKAPKLKGHRAGVKLVANYGECCQTKNDQADNTGFPRPK
jgi:UDP-N-acetyl-D-mannosaminuronic acid transferase (WecB/TagA/CpsF family)